MHHIRHLDIVAEDAEWEIDYEELMVKAETKYDKLVKTKVWNKKDPRDEQILSLQSQVKKLQGKRAKRERMGKMIMRETQQEVEEPLKTADHILLL